MLDAERALANAESLAGVIPAAAAAAVADACRAELYDPARLGEDGRAAGNPVEPLVRALRGHVAPDAAQYVHWGATSQDILDSAAMLVTRRALRLIDDDLSGAADACASLARAHRETPIAGRTLLQQAVPTTFGLKAAGWLVAVVEARGRLRSLAGALPAQLGGAAGTLAPLGDSGPEVLRLYAAELELREPTLPWHTDRRVVAELGSALAVAAGALGKAGRDVALLAQTEVAEVAEGSGGASSTMPQKRNPVGAVLAVACAAQARGHASVLLESLVAEHERAAGAWHAEWQSLAGALAATGGAAAALRRSLEGLVVDAARMLANIGAGAMAERASFLLAERMDRGEATKLLAAGASPASLGLREEDLDPAGSLGSAPAFVDRALALYEEAQSEETQ